MIIIGFYTNEAQLMPQHALEGHFFIYLAKDIKEQ